MIKFPLNFVVNKLKVNMSGKKVLWQRKVMMLYLISLRLVQVAVSLEEGRLEHLQDEPPVLQVEWVQDAILLARFTELTGEVSSCHTYVLEMVKGVDPGTIQDQLEQVLAEPVELHFIVKEVNTMGQEHVGCVIVD